MGATQVTSCRYNNDSDTTYRLEGAGMSETAPDVAVLRHEGHGLSAEDYAAAIRDRLPDHDVQLARTPHQERELVKEAPIVTGLFLEPDILDAAENLKLFACMGAGYNHLPLDELEDRGIVVTNASGIHAPNMAEGIIGNILTFARNLREGWRRKERPEWRHFKGHELKRSTVTVVGLGSIGTATVERLEGFDVHTIGVRYTPEKGGPTDEVIGFGKQAFDEALSRTEYLVIACPLSDTTRGLIGDDEFMTLPTESILINVARGPIVDTDALVSAIRSNQIRGAAVDVTDPEPLPEDHALWRYENVLITPHNAGHTPKHWDRLADILARNVEQIDETGSYTDLENQVLTVDS